MTLWNRLQRATASTGPVIITGEPGSGRTHTARRIHTLSGRTGAFTDLDVASIPLSLCGPELFGVFGSAFDKTLRRGRCERAAHGTLCIKEPHLLDEGDQQYLIEFVETGFVDVANRRGMGMARHVDDVRVIAVLEWVGLTVRCSRFVDALRTRPDAVHIDIPPLRARKEEIEPLFNEFLREFATERGAPPVQPTFELLASLQEHSWPGNVAELRALAQRVAAGDSQ